jgi:hypothetical protein
MMLKPILGIGHDHSSLVSNHGTFLYLSREETVTSKSLSASAEDHEPQA